MQELLEDVIERTPHLLRVRFPEVGGDYELTCSPALAQAVGRCGDVDFVFRAKPGWWEFETEDEHGHSFPEGDPRRFVRGGTCDVKKPGTMGIEWARRILGRCLAEFWDAPA